MLVFGSGARDDQGCIEKEIATGEWERDLELVPTAEAFFGLNAHSDWHNGQAGEFGESDDSFLHDVFGAARAVRSDGDVITFLHPGGEFKQGLGATAAGGTADGLDSVVFEGPGEEGTILARADECGEARLDVPPFHLVESGHGKGKAIVPDGEDDLLAAGREQSGAVLEVDAPGAFQRAAQGEDHERGDAPVPGGLIGHDNSAFALSWRFRIHVSAEIVREGTSQGNSLIG